MSKENPSLIIFVKLSLLWVTFQNEFDCLLSPLSSPIEFRKSEPPLSLTPSSPSIRHREAEIFLINDDKWVKIQAEHCTQRRALVTQQNAAKPRGSISHGNETISTNRQEQGKWRSHGS